MRKILLALACIPILSVDGFCQSDSTLSPTSKATTLHNEAVEFQRQGNYDDALTRYDQAIKIDPTDAEYYYSLGTCFQAMDRLDDALKNYRKARSMKPDEPRYSAAINHAAKAQSTNLHKRAVEYQRQGLLSMALDTYREAIQNDPSNPGDPDLLYSLGTCFHAMNRIDEALEYYRKAAEINSVDPGYRSALERALLDKADPLVKLGVEEFGKSNYTAAIRYFTAALEISDSPLIHYDLAIALSAAGHEQEAMKELQKSGQLQIPQIRPDPAIPRDLGKTPTKDKSQENKS